MKVIKRAWKVWVHSHLEESGYNTPDFIPHIHANSLKEAKAQCDLYDAKNEYGDKARYIDIKARRSPSNDIVEHYGEEMPRYIYEDRLVKEKRNAKLQALDADEMYYVQDSRSYCGNSVFWWSKESRGYTTDLNMAHKYTKDEIVKRFSNGRETDIIWKASHVEQHIKTHVDAQYLERDFCV